MHSKINDKRTTDDHDLKKKKHTHTKIIPHQVKEEDPKILECWGCGAGENENEVTLKLNETAALNSGSTGC